MYTERERERERERDFASQAEIRPIPPISIIPTKIACLKLSGKPLRIKIILESNPLESIMLVGRLAICGLSQNKHIRELSGRKQKRPNQFCTMVFGRSKPFGKLLFQPPPK